MTETNEPAALPEDAAPATPGTPETPAQSGMPAAGKKPQRERIDVRPVLEKLFQLHPKLFGAKFLPLKLGIYEELLARNPDAFKPEELKAALGVHARSTRYLEAVASGAQRHDLDGQPAGELAPEHVHHAIMEVFRRKNARNAKEAAQWLKSRMLRAVEASGLSREDYVEKMRVFDEQALAAVTEAYAEITARDAKRVALRRAFEASGQSVEAFAEMYGMKPGEVKRLLA